MSEKVKQHVFKTGFKKILISWFLIILSAQVGWAEGRSSLNDQELGLLFNNLLKTQSSSDADKISSKIWKIWTNDTSNELGRSRMIEGVSLMNRNNLVAAEELFSNLIRSSPEYIEAWNKRATIRFMMGQFERSLSDVYVVLSKEPKHFGAMSGLGLIMIQKEDFKEALRAYKKVLLINPFSQDALNLVPALEQKVLGKSI
jgi:tetratricopeptide (TPR) repeat protein